MEVISKEEFKKSHRTVVLMGMALISSVFLYAFIVELIHYSGSLGKSKSLPNMDLLKYFFLSLSVVEFFLIRMLRNLILAGKIIGGKPAFQDGTMMARLQMTAIMSYAFSESVAIYGFVLFLLSGIPLNFYIFMVLSLGFFIYYFPRYSQWKEWITAGGGMVSEKVYSLDIF